MKTWLFLLFILIISSVSADASSDSDVCIGVDQQNCLFLYNVPWFFIFIFVSAFLYFKFEKKLSKITYWEAAGIIGLLLATLILVSLFLSTTFFLKLCQ